MALREWCAARDHADLKRAPTWVETWVYTKRKQILVFFQYRQAETTSANEPNFSSNFLAIGLTSRRGNARNSTSSRSSYAAWPASACRDRGVLQIRRRVTPGRAACRALAATG